MLRPLAASELESKFQCALMGLFQFQMENKKMFLKQAILPTMAAALFAAISPMVSLQDKIDQSLAVSQLDDQLFVMNRVLDRLDSGSEVDAAMAETLKAVREDLDATSRAQAEEIQQMKTFLVAMESKVSDFDSLLDTFTEKVVEKSKAEVEDAEELPASGVGTLDVTTVPSSGDRPESFSDLVDLVVELKASVKALESRSVSTSASVPSYQAVSGPVSSGGSCGTSVAGYSSQAYTSYASSGTQSVSYAAPVVSYSAPMTSYPSVAVATPAYAGTVRYSQRAVTPLRRTVLRRSTPSTANCTMVRGADGVYRQVCTVR